MIRKSAILILPGAFATLFACTLTSPSEPGADAGPSGDAAQPDVRDGAARVLDVGGPLVAPFRCPTDAIQHEPRPAAQLLELLRVSASLDSLTERVATRADAGADGGQPAVKPVTAGAPCSSATDGAACQLAFAQLSSDGQALRPAFDEVDYMDPAFHHTPPGYYLAHTKGNAVGKVSNVQELRALYPTVDAPAKAIVFAHAAGYRVECHLERWLREEPDGYVLVASRGHERRCSRVDVVLFVRRDGSTEERDVIENQPDPCT